MWLAQVLGSIILAAIAGFLYAKTRERFMAFWLVGWGLALISGSPVESRAESTALVVLCEATRVVGASFILRGNSAFLGRKVPAAYQVWTVATLGWVVVGLPLSFGSVLGTLVLRSCPRLIYPPPNNERGLVLRSAAIRLL